MDVETRRCEYGAVHHDLCPCRLKAKEKIQELEERNKLLENKLVIANGLSHDGTTITCNYCLGNSSDYYKGMHLKDCNYLIAEKSLKSNTKSRGK